MCGYAPRDARVSTAASIVTMNGYNLQTTACWGLWQKLNQTGTVPYTYGRFELTTVLHTSGWTLLSTYSESHVHQIGLSHTMPTPPSGTPPVVVFRLSGVFSVTTEFSSH